MLQTYFIRKSTLLLTIPQFSPDLDLVVSGGNFESQTLALAFDYMGVALHELGNISEPCSTADS